MDVPEQITPASSAWLQLFIPQGFAWHWLRADSVPMHWTSFSQMGLFPLPNWAPTGAELAGPQPSCWQITKASAMLQPSSQTVPHWPSWNNSTLPLQLLEPFTSLISTAVSEMKSTPRQIKFQRVSQQVRDWMWAHKMKFRHSPVQMTYWYRCIGSNCYRWIYTPLEWPGLNIGNAFGASFAPGSSGVNYGLECCCPA